MINCPRCFQRLLFVLACAVPGALTAQTLTITNGVQKYASLAATTVNMSGKCELWVTNSSAPLSGCTINLNSTDAWLFLSGIKPSIAVSTYLGQVRMNGASAVADSNVRVVQFGQSGAVVIPYPSSFKPLTVYSAANFTGASAQFSPWTYYTGTGLGAMDLNIRSFKLKRGYQAVFAQNTDGSGISQCYVAQDGDLEIGALPSTLSGKARFIYITQWRWTAKKGIAGDPGIPLLNVLWWYDWNIDQNSSRDLEYVAIRQNASWPGISGQNWQSRGVNSLLGFNEPDSSSQANMSVSSAISEWPLLLSSGLRVGSPAVTDGGRSSWLYPFMQQADSNGLRVDFVAIHYYQAHNPSDPSGAASQMYNFLLDVWNHTHRPVWVTEWNNGANWTDNNPWPAPTYDQQQACIAAMVNMLETTPFVERYALYNWVENTRAVVTNGVLTSAGVTYSNQVSNLSYSQAMPDNGTRSLAQFLFETNTFDTSGYGNNCMAVGAPAFTNGYHGQAIALDGANSYLQLPANIADSNAFTFAAWVYWNGGSVQTTNWQRIFDFGNDTSHYLFLTPNSGGSTLRFAINNGGGEQQLNAPTLASGQWQHVAVTLSGGTAKLYLNGAQVASSSSFTVTPASFSPVKNYLGKSQFSADPLFNGILDDVQIADYALSASQIASLMTNLPPQFTTNFIDRGTAAPFVPFATNITGMATDPNPGGTLAYSKAAGPAWLTVNSDGTMSGTPGAGDGGTNYFTVRVTDPAGASAFATVAVYVPITYGNGVWIKDANGSWDDSINWSGGVIANGGNGSSYTADFSTLNITADRTVTLDSARTISTLKFGDTSGSQNWTLASSGPALTLDTGSGAVPSIVVNQNMATISAALAGSNGLTKSGAGTLVLSGANSISGTLNVDTAQASTGNDGVLRIASPDAFGNVSAINILDQNSATSTLQLDGSNGDIACNAPIALNGRNSSAAAIQNLAGNSTLSGGITINVGGANYWFRSDTGLLTLGGAITSAAGGTRTFTFQGSGNVAVTGNIINGNATNSVVKSGAGTLTLAGANTYSGTTTVSGGALFVDGSISTGAVTVSSGTLGGNGRIFGPVTMQSGTMLAPGDGLGALTVNNSLTLSTTTTNSFEFDVAGAANDTVTVTGALTPGGSKIALAVNGTLPAGVYRLFNYGTKNGSFDPNIVVVSGAVNGTAFLDESVSGQINLVVSNTFGGVSFKPFALDANTLVLMHFDGATGSSVVPNLGTLGKNAYSVDMSTASSTPPVVTTVLGAAGYPGFGNAANLNTSGYLLGFDANASGTYQGETLDFINMSTLNMGNGGQTPWTLEAMISPTVTNVNQEIICTDSSAANRGFQFRLNSAGQLELNLIYLGVDLKAAIPSSGVHAFSPGQWYHVAATYDGTSVILYWTKVYPTITAINPISTNSSVVGASFGSVQGPLVVGNENRGAAGENFHGLIDEVRISSVARSATNMLFMPPANVAPAKIVAFGFAGNGTLQLSAQGTPGGGYTLYATTNLVPPAAWSAVAATNAAGDSTLSFEIPLNADPMKFFNIGSP